MSEQQIIDQLAGGLIEVYQQIVATRVSRIVHEEHERFHGRPTRDFVPSFVERNAKVELAKVGA